MDAAKPIRGEEFDRLVNEAPLVSCPSCSVEMPVRSLKRHKDEGTYTASFRCPKCGTETLRDFSVPTT